MIGVGFVTLQAAAVVEFETATERTAAFSASPVAVDKEYDFEAVVGVGIL